ncbi:MAG: serine protease [Gammaproteobacteria bacterium]|nr:serine protease [Gammaproteobacteria bacterium]
MVENNNSVEDKLNAPASLEILTGPARGTASWLSGTALDISLNKEDMIRIAEAGSEPLIDGVVARLHRSGDGYEIEAREQNPLWINGARVDSKRLEQCDLIEFGDKGPLSRYRLHHQGDRVRRSLGDMLDDAIDYTRVSRKPRIARWQRAFQDICSDFALRTTILFRASVILALLALAVIVYQQYRSGLLLQQQAERSAHKLEDFARALTRTNREALRPSDLNQLRQELGHSLSAAAERLELLEQRSAASTRIIAEATRSIVFLQGAYSFRDTETNRMLRYQVNAEGDALFTLRGQPLLTLEGEGEIAERRFTGTGFVVNKSGALLSNRHVALPWEEDTSDEALIAAGMEPVLIKFVGYLPGIEAAFPVELLKASEEADLAILQCSEVVDDLPYLDFSTRLPAPGDEVIVMGYPTGMRSMLAQTGDDFLAELQADESLDSWEVAKRLSRAQFIRPLASRGIVGQLSESTVVYDADTTHGGSGGPVLDIEGNAIAINTAIIPEYGGSNFGVPVEYARRLLADAGITVD